MADKEYVESLVIAYREADNAIRMTERMSTNFDSLLKIKDALGSRLFALNPEAFISILEEEVSLRTLVKNER